MQERLARAFAHRLFLVGTGVAASGGGGGGDGAPPSRRYAVLGSTANVYTVVIATRPTCTCPDHLKTGGPCKHQLFVLHRVLKVGRADPVLWQTSLTATEVDAVFAAAPPVGEGGGGILASPAVRAGYAAATGGRPAGGGVDGAPADGASGAAGGDAARRPLTDDDDCPICCDTMGTAAAATDWCRACKNNVHAECIGKWLAVKAAAGEAASCPMCRTAWHTVAAAAAGRGGRGRGGGGRAAAAGGYVNLASVSDAHTERLSMQERYPETARFMGDGWRARRGLAFVRDDDEG
ncbi:hypothetical protein BU14_0611s0002 [Porphyra umbilicalis]|uniref:SWIM-type domain-containing protein n=1 Tax=Porphyra umbilicalis TaxID=2786 RepID=A0A1X6NR02_PORUM|nr:hypothetical protein BU14_0611s0002 [Porphyra umbilicalis]|eukprot:OSX71044.1 hypothetical protein BU14_0611s0002 [Porphyra umbilicalis]